MDEVRFEEGGVVAHMQKGAGRDRDKDAQKNPPITIRNPYREHLERYDYVCNYPGQSPREVIARTTANRRFMCPDYFWRLGRSDKAKADAGPLQPRV